MKTSAFSLTRRTALFAAAATGFVAAAPLARANNEQAFANSPWRKLSDADWKNRLPPEAYQVLRHQATEQPFTSPLLHEERKGIFACAGCVSDLFSSSTKFDSGTGWPSFWAPLKNAVDTHPDHSWGMSRSAVTCHRCDGHLGHVFDDGPKPTGLRYCMNGVALTFKPATA